MKKWECPKVWIMGVENTKTEESNVDFWAAWGGHTCHRESKYHDGNCSSGQGHTAIKTGDCEEHKDLVVYTDKNGVNYSCCCVGLS